MLAEMTQQYILRLSDSDLIEYVVEGIYEPEAIEFAKREIERRNLDSEKFHQLEAAARGRVEVKQAEIVAAANQELSPTGKTFAFILGFFGFVSFWLFIAWLAFDNTGKTQKKKDLIGFAVYGFATMAATVVLIVLIQKWLQ